MIRADELPRRDRERCMVWPGGRLEFHLPAELRSPNTYLGMHWREKHRERAQWADLLTNAVIGAQGVAGAQLLLGPKAPLPGCVGRCDERRCVEVVRLVPLRRRFIRDDDNLRFSVKPLLDAITRVGLIHDDAREWLELPLPRQDISTDGACWTWLTIRAPTC